MPHQQVTVETRNGPMQVDAGVAPLVLALNELPEFVTVASCECADDDDADGLAWVSFDWAEGFARGDVIPIFDALRKRLPPESHVELSMRWSPPQSWFPPLELRCDPDDVREVAEAVLRLAKARASKR